MFYSLESLSEPMRDLMFFNPLTLIIENVRRILLHTQWPQWEALALYTLAACVFAWLAGLFFQATRKGFADVL